ncbi:MAG: DUF3305 domain-containing protein [Hyphomicrobiales bacterium]
MSKLETLDIGVVVERRRIDHPWQEWAWKAVAVIAGARPVEPWTQIGEGDGWVQFHAATMPLELHRRETEAYVANLETERPSVYVVLRDDEDGEGAQPYYVALVTVSPYDAQDYQDSGEDLVEAVPMPEPVLAWMQDFIGQHHVEEPFVKRKRDKVKIEDHKFGQEPLVELRQRMARAREDDSDD